MWAASKALALHKPLPCSLSRCLWKTLSCPREWGSGFQESGLIARPEVPPRRIFIGVILDPLC